MIVSDFMRTNPSCVDVNATFRDVLTILNKERTDSVLVVNANKEVHGIISRSHALKQLSGGIDVLASVQEIMEKKIISIEPTVPIEELITWNVSSLPVIKNKKLLGIITLSETIHAYNSYMVQLKQDLEAVLNGVYNGIISVNLNNEIQTINNSARKLFGLGTRDIIGEKIDDIVGCDIFSEVIEKDKEIINRRVLLEDKTLICTFSIMKDYRGKQSGGVVIFQDSTELEEVYRQLFKTKELSEELDAIIESSFDGILVMDKKGKIRIINTSLKKILGIKNAPLFIGKEISSLKEYLNVELLERLTNDNKVVTQSCRLESGAELLITANPITGENNTVEGIVANVRDISNLIMLENKLNALNALYAQQVRKGDLLNKYVFDSPVSKKMVNMALQVASVDSTVLITGESGVGKEVVANFIVESSNRKDMPYVKINCGALPSNLLESELFGYEAGAFTGASKKGKLGLWEIASKGTLLLDEIGDLPHELQVKVLRAIQEGEIIKVGSTTPIKVDVRIIASTNKDLKHMVNAGLFRADLYYRLNVVPIEVPTLRERKVEIPALVNVYITKYNEKYGLNKKLGEHALDDMIRYDWPGNIRELENVIERSLVTSESDIINNIVIEFEKENSKLVLENKDIDFKTMTYKEYVYKYERELLIKALERYGSTRATGKAIGIDQSTIVKKAAKFGLKLDPERSDE